MLLNKIKFVFIWYKNANLIRDLFDEAYEDYYIPIKTIISFDNKNNYIEYENKGGKDKNLSLKEYLYMIAPYWKALMKLKVYLGNEVIHYEIHSKDSGETCAMCTMSDNIEIMMSSETDEVIKEL